MINNVYYEKGRAQLMNIELHGKNMSIVCVYAPNKERDRICFFQDLKLWILENTDTPHNIILAGDFNCCLLQNDRSTNSHVNDKSRNALNCLLTTLDINDTWVKFGMSSSHYTWDDGNTKSRLDYIFASKMCTAVGKKVVNKIVISDQIGSRITDHKAVEFCASVILPAKGPGYWKLNCSHLKSDIYKSGISNVIKSLLAKYSDQTKSRFAVWEILKREVKIFSIRYATDVAKQKQNVFKTLESELQNLDKVDLSNEELNKKEEIQI